MDLLFLFWASLLLCIAVVRAGEHAYSFRTNVEEDQIIYSKVVVPQHSQRVYVKISADGVLPEGMEPKILLRYNGLPTLESHDAMYPLPGVQDAFEVVDSQPSEATLFFAFWGGALPNSYRHFAGKARSVTLTMNTMIFACETEVLSGNDCSEELVSVSASANGTQTIMLLEKGESKKTGVLILPDGLDKVVINGTLTEVGLKNLCDAWRRAKQDKSRTVTDKVAVIYRFFMNQADEDRESGRVSQSLSMPKECSSIKGEKVSSDSAAIVVNRPYSGTWRMSVEMVGVGVEDGGKPGKSADYLYDSAQEISLVSRYFTCPSGFTGMGEYSSTQRFRMQEGSYLREGEPELQDCQLPVIPLRSFRSSNRRAGLQLRSADTQLSSSWQEETGVPSPDPQKEIERVSLKQRRVGNGIAGASAMFSGSLEYLQLASVVGGLVQIEMRIRPLVGQLWITTGNTASTGLNGTHLEALKRQEQAEKELRVLSAGQIQSRLRDNHFLVSLRIGAPPSDATVPISAAAARRAKGGSSVLEPLDALSSDALVLSTRDAVVRPLDDASAPGTSEAWRGDEKDEASGVLSPALRIKVPDDPRRSEAGKHGEVKSNSRGEDAPEILAGLQFVWTLRMPTINELTASSLHSLDSLYMRVTKVGPTIKFSSTSPEFENFVANVGINIAHCHAGSCVHGKCVVNEESDVQHFACECHYPYGGERCEQMAVDMPLYVVQVLLLVSSNIAAMPGIVLSAHHHLFMLAMCIFLAALSSSLYHLCDMGVLCVGGLSYASYQVFDVLFCLTTVGVVCVHHSPLGTEAISALTILIIAAIVPGVVHDATHPMTVVSSVVVSFGLLLCTWLNYSARLAVRTRRRAKGETRDARLGRHKSDIDPSDEVDEDIGVELGSLHSPSSSAAVSGGVESEGVGLLSGRAKGEKSVMHDSIKFDETRKQQDIEDNEALMAARALFAENKSLVAKLRFLSRELRPALFGGFIALMGLAAFLSQTRENYSITHSIWHVCVMLSTYFFIAGRRAVIRNIRAIVHHVQT